MKFSRDQIDSIHSDIRYPNNFFVDLHFDNDKEEKLSAFDEYSIYWKSLISELISKSLKQKYNKNNKIKNDEINININISDKKEEKNKEEEIIETGNINNTVDKVNRLLKQLEEKNISNNNNNKNKNVINKKFQTSNTKNSLNQNSKFRNSKRNGLIDIISNFKENRNSMNQAKKKSKDKNETNPNINNIINKSLKDIKPPLQKESTPKEKETKNIPQENNEKDEDELSIFNFEEYKIITQLGQGSFGKIYLVQNSKNELFTMKKLVYSEELDVKSVIKEYKMCYKLKHPNVVKILGIYSKKLDKTTFVVYVLMEVGMTDWEKEIKTHIEKNMFYTEKELIHIMKQLIQVLSFLQKSNISHRDIKPQNILVFKNNIYKIADFGEAKQIENMTINLLSNSLRGTELYMSPLLFNGLRTGQVDIKHNVFKSDVYSFGLCVLFAASLQMITLYDIRRIVDMQDIKKYLDKMLGDKYSKKFIEFVAVLLEIHEKNRPDFIQLEHMIKDLDVNE
jgi:hypothetical protein